MIQVEGGEGDLWRDQEHKLQARVSLHVCKLNYQHESYDLADFFGFFCGEQLARKGFLVALELILCFSG